VASLGAPLHQDILIANIRLGLKGLQVSNTPAYFEILRKKVKALTPIKQPLSGIYIDNMFEEKAPILHQNYATLLTRPHWAKGYK
jgi:hypothetical protein